MGRRNAGDHHQQLLKDLKTQLGRLQDDLRQRASDVAEIDQALRAEYAAATRARRTADTFETWREDPITQAGVAWVLGTVFVRFLEDNGLIEPRLSGVGDNRRFALDRHAAYFQQHPLETDREYLLHVFHEVGQLPAGREIFDEHHNPLWRLTPSGDAVKDLVELWQRIDPGTGTVAHELSDSAWDTRLLGDLYQDLSEAARKKYALLQTPRFVESFILDRTLTPAIETFGYATHLAPIDRTTARALLENQRSQLVQKLRHIIDGAYGLMTLLDGTIDTSLEHPLAEHFQSLDPGVRRQPPVAADMRSALKHLLNQALSRQFPRHPLFEVDGEIRPAALRKVFGEVQKAIQAPGGRLFVEQGEVRRLMRQVAVPLGLGEMGEQHFVLGLGWVQHFDRKVAETGEARTVRRLRAWLDEP